MVRDVLVGKQRTRHLETEADHLSPEQALKALKQALECETERSEAARMPRNAEALEDPHELQPAEASAAWTPEGEEARDAQVV